MTVCSIPGIGRRVSFARASIDIEKAIIQNRHSTKPATYVDFVDFVDFSQGLVDDIGFRYLLSPVTRTPR
jgi:hypothetical protein